MQLPLGPDPRTQVLREAQARLEARFGPVPPRPDHHRDPAWALVQGVIGAQTKSAISNAATDALLARYERWEDVAAAPLAELTGILARQTFPELSAQRLKASLSRIMELRGSVDLRHLSNLPTHEAMTWLEALPGVGRKIAAGVMNTSTFARRAMVIDGHHRRIMQRMGIVPGKADTSRSYDILMQIAPPEWDAATMDAHHLQLKRLGQTHCRPRAPQCEACPVADLCQWYAANRAG